MAQFPAFGLGGRRAVAVPDLPLDGGVVSREQIERLAVAMAAQPVELPEPVHHFTPGIYARELTVPRGVVLLGKRHKCPHLFMVTKGWMYVYGTEGKSRVQAGDVFASQPGAQRVAWAPEVDCTCVAVHATETTDLHQLEHELVEPFAVLGHERNEVLQ